MQPEYRAADFYLFNDYQRWFPNLTAAQRLQRFPDYVVDFRRWEIDHPDIIRDLARNAQERERFQMFHNFRTFETLPQNRVGNYQTHPNNRAWYIGDQNERQFVNMDLLETDYNRMNHAEINLEILIRFGNYDQHDILNYINNNLNIVQKRNVLKIFSYFTYRRSVFNTFLRRVMNGGPNLLMLLGEANINGFRVGRVNVLELYLRQVPRFRQTMQVDFQHQDLNLRGTLSQFLNNFINWVNAHFPNELTLARLETLKKMDDFSVLWAVRRAFWMLRFFNIDQGNHYDWNDINRLNIPVPQQQNRRLLWVLMCSLLQMIVDFGRVDRRVMFNLLKEIDYRSYRRRGERRHGQNAMVHNFKHIFPYFIGKIDIQTQTPAPVVYDIVRRYFVILSQTNDFIEAKISLTFRAYFTPLDAHPSAGREKFFVVSIPDIRRNRIRQYIAPNGADAFWQDVRNAVDALSQAHVGTYNEDIVFDDYQLVKINLFGKTRHANAQIEERLRLEGLTGFCRSVKGRVSSLMIGRQVTDENICLYESYFQIINSEEYKKGGRFYRMKQHNLKDLILQSFLNEDDELKNIVFEGMSVDLKNYLFRKKHIDINILVWERKELSFLAERDHPLFFNKNNKLTLCLKAAHAFVVESKDLIHFIESDFTQYRNVAEALKKDQEYWEKKNEINKPFILRKKKKYKFKPRQNEDWALDVETFLSAFSKNTPKIEMTGKHVPYLLCLVNINDFSQRISFKGTDCVRRFLDWLYEKVLREEKKINIWTYNGHKFDLLFLLNDIIRDYTVELIGSVTDIKKLKFRNVEFFDFYKIFPVGSLSATAKAWNVACQKGSFDHSKMNKDTFWQHMDEAEEYCLLDCKALACLVLKFQHLCNNEYHVTHYQHSCSSFALDVFRTNYLAEGEELKGVPWQYYQIFRKSYFGGFTQLFKKKSHAPILYYYDINSSYPASMRDSIYPCDFQLYDPYFTFSLCDGSHLLKSHFLYLVKRFVFNDNLLYPPIPEKDEKGFLHYRLSSRELHYIWGEEILFYLSKSLLVEIEIEGCFIFTAKKIYESFISDLYQKRQKAKAEGNYVKEQTDKYVMNNLYGKKGQRLFPTKVFVNGRDANYYSVCSQQFFSNKNVPRKKIVDLQQVTDDIYCIEFDETPYGIGSLVHIASFTTMKSRLRLYEALYSLTDNGKLDYVLYTDTDSLVSERPLSEKYLDDVELGKFKLEGIIPGDSWIGLAPKFYLMHRISILSKKNVDVFFEDEQKPELKEQYLCFKYLVDRFDYDGPINIFTNRKKIIKKLKTFVMNDLKEIEQDFADLNKDNPMRVDEFKRVLFSDSEKSMLENYMWFREVLINIENFERKPFGGRKNMYVEEFESYYKSYARLLGEANLYDSEKTFIEIKEKKCKGVQKKALKKSKMIEFLKKGQISFMNADQFKRLPGGVYMQNTVKFSKICNKRIFIDEDPYEMSKPFA